MQTLQSVAAAIAGTLSMTVALHAQTPDYEAAARHADRAVRAYDELQSEKRAEQVNEALAAALVHERICKPMHDQNALSRRNYIASVVKGRARQRAVAAECAQQELWYAELCKPKTYYKDFETHTWTEPFCPKRWADWPLPPPVWTYEYNQRLAEIRKLYR